MKTNMGSTDKIIRSIVAIIIAVLYFTNTITGALGIVLMVFAVIFLITSFVSFCPLYSLFGFSTKKERQ